MEKIQGNFLQGDPCFIQKIYSTPHFLILQVRKIGQTQFLFLGRGGPYQGAFLSSINATSDKRIVDRYLEYARANWRGAKVFSVTHPFKDRVLCIDMIFQGSKKRVYFFWRGRDLFFAQFQEKGHETTLFCSWLGSELIGVKDDQWENVFREKTLPLGLEDKNQDSSDKSFSLELYLSEPFTLKQTSKKLKKRKKRKEERIKQEILRNQSYDELYKIADDLDYLNSIDFYTFYNKKIRFYGCKNVHQKRDLIFDLAKRLKKGLEIQKKRLESLKNSDKPEEMTIEKPKTIQPIWKTTEASTSKKVFLKEQNLKKVYLEDVMIGWLGLNAQGNDYIRSRLAKKDHMWFHIDGYTSGHFIYTGDKSSDFALFELIGSMLREISKLDLLEIPIVFTKVKNLKGLKGQPGSVLYKKEKRLNVQYQKNWGQKIALL